MPLLLWVTRARHRICNIPFRTFSNMARWLFQIVLLSTHSNGYFWGKTILSRCWQQALEGRDPRTNSYTLLEGSESPRLLGSPIGANPDAPIGSATLWKKRKCNRGSTSVASGKAETHFLSATIRMQTWWSAQSRLVCAKQKKDTFPSKCDIPWMWPAD
jgi:hypothetical protein